MRGLSQVAGMADLKEQLMHEVLGPFRDPDLPSIPCITPERYSLLRSTRLWQNLYRTEIG